MIADDPGWRSYPILRELFQQWRAARAAEPVGTFQQPFRRNWETLLEDAHLVSGEARREADRDARALAAIGLVELKTVRYRPYQIERIGVPIDAEPRFRALFADELPDLNVTRFDPANIAWEPELAFLRETRSGIAGDDLLKLNEFFAARETSRPSLPIKERSLQLFGDEKRLDALRMTALFAEGRLTLDHLRCFAVPEPLGWRRGPTESGPLIVIENASTWDSYSRWNADRNLFSAVVYGGGNRFVDSVVRIADIFAEIGGTRAVLYFGDLDVQGLRIPQAASRRAKLRGLPAIAPHLWSYAQLIDIAGDRASPAADVQPAEPIDFTWLGVLGNRARAILARAERIAQEHLGWEQLSRVASPSDSQLTL